MLALEEAENRLMTGYFCLSVIMSLGLFGCHQVAVNQPRLDAQSRNQTAMPRWLHYEYQQSHDLINLYVV